MFKLNRKLVLLCAALFLVSCNVTVQVCGAESLSPNNRISGRPHVRHTSPAATDNHRGEVNEEGTAEKPRGGEETFSLRDSAPADASYKDGTATAVDVPDQPKEAEAKGRLAPFYNFFKALAVHISFLAAYLWYSVKIVEPKVTACEAELKEAKGADNPPSGEEVMVALKAKHPGVASGLAVMEAAVITTMIAAITAWFIGSELQAARKQEQAAKQATEKENTPEAKVV